MADPIAVLNGVIRRYGAATALDGLSLAIHAGETVALLGANGAGKTTAVETLLGLADPDDGQVELFGGSPHRAVEAGRVEVMLQDAGLPQGVRVGELIGLIRGLYRAPSPLEETLRLVDLADVADRQVQRLSGGQRQRVRLALALVGHPDLVVLDEPTAALDVEARRAFWAGVDVSVAAGQTVLFATHRLDEADAVADRVIVIAHGRVVADGTPTEVKSASRGRSTVRVAADGLTAELLAALPGVLDVEADRAGFALHTNDPDRTVRALLERAPGAKNLEVARAGMEEAFLSLIREEAS
ncbi:MAG: ABC transporter ATP-binding protein [Acidimicrobiia bacterium]